LGLILECPKQGTDHLVYEYVIKKFCPTINLVVVPAGSTNKPDMINKCGKVAELLLHKDRCDKVAIIWDLMPPWGGRACRKTDIEAIIRNLSDYQVDLNRIKLICIEPELEGWLIVDGNGITKYKQYLSHPHPVPPFTGIKLRPQSNDAKKRITRYLGRRYNDLLEAIKIVKYFDDFDRIVRKHPSFRRLKTFIDQICDH